MTDIEKIQIVNKWFDENHYLFKLDQYYGIDIVAELYQLVQKCSYDGGELESIHKSGTMENRQESEVVRTVSLTVEEDK